tara:strand:- start:89 stop:289 length:201 start_codon:yes stop_codon:yes gene_type:complete
MDDAKKKDDETMAFLNSPIVLMLVGAVMIVGVWYVISPIQNCLRASGTMFQACTMVNHSAGMGLRW